jgi:hypothetical protein
MKYFGAYYLHENGDLIWKNAIVFESDPQYFDSPFVKKVWYIPAEPPTDSPEGNITWTMNWLREAYKFGAKADSVHKIIKENNMPESFYNSITGKIK